MYCPRPEPMSAMADIALQRSATLARHAAGRA